MALMIEAVQSSGWKLALMIERVQSSGWILVLMMTLTARSLNSERPWEPHESIFPVPQP